MQNVFQPRTSTGGRARGPEKPVKSSRVIRASDGSSRSVRTGADFCGAEAGKTRRHPVCAIIVAVDQDTGSRTSYGEDSNVVLYSISGAVEGQR